jgi:AI-2 transport protein TqsA
MLKPETKSRYNALMAREHKEEKNWVITVSLVILAVVALATALIYTRPIMIPFVVALFIVALVSPIEDFQVKWLRLPRAVAIVVTLLIVLFFITLVTLSLAQVGRTIAYTATGYSESFARMGFKALDLVAYLYRPQTPPPAATPNEPKQTTAAPNEPKPVEKKPEAFELFPLIKDAAQPATLNARPWSEPPPAKEPAEPNAAEPNLPAPAAAPGTGALAPEPPSPPESQWQSIAKQMVLDLKNYIFNILTSTVGTIFGMISGVFFVIIFVIFLLLGRNPHAEHSQVYTDIVQKIRRYVGIKVAISVMTGVLVWATLRIIGLKLAGVFGILAFLLNFIPSIGSVIATVLPIPIAVVQFQSSPWLIVLAVAIPGAIQNILGNIIEPKLQGEGLNLHPVTILLALSFWGLLWGIVGMFLAAPITAAIRIVLMQFETFRPIADVLAGDFSGMDRTRAVRAQARRDLPVPDPQRSDRAPAPPGGTEPVGAQRG